MKVLVTGGAGFIGSVVAQQLVDAGHDVVVYDNLSKGHRAAVPAGAEFIQGDVGDESRLRRALRQGIDAVMHFAALIQAGESMHVPERYFRNNSAHTLTLLESMLAEGVKHCVFSSTAAVYGEPQRIPVEESDPLIPTNVYGESKLLAERMLDWFHRVHDVRYASLRYFNAAGAAGDLGEAHEPESHLIPLILQVALGRRKQITIYGGDYDTPDGTCVRDYIHVLDISQAHVLAVEALENHSQLIYNLGNGQGFSVREVIDTCRQVTGHPIPEQVAPRRAGDPAVLVASSRKIRDELGWKPEIPNLKDIVATAWEWHRRYPAGYELTEASHR
ncbi:MAG: UDP-glucose 4-epimerase GalE [Acidobacteriales bacterium]|nr:UDP-glucose 4-epimerase GalE [Terriglobales bacterium]